MTKAMHNMDNKESRAWLALSHINISLQKLQHFFEHH